MRELRYRKIDAFTAGDSLGNPAACVYLENGQTLSDAEMLDIAKQHKGFVSEVVYCIPEAAAFRLTYYSSECEVDFCGHGTIACMYNLIRETSELYDRREIEIRTNKKGNLTAFNDVATRNAVCITAPEPRYIGTNLEVGTIAENLRLVPAQISRSQPLDVIDAGLRTLIVPLRTLADEVGVFPDEKRLKLFCLDNEIDIVLIYSLETKDPKSIAHTRVFAPRFGYLEDPATGSGNSAFGYYMLKNGLWDESDVFVEQGGSDRVFNAVNLSFRDGRVLFGGRATTRIKGVYCL